ncbi:MAG: insulinase family protein, partial [Oscillospiraceae bacterium]|jgi:predicted Zn-dependent peptidase|nr:insulinase family protein [Oscillospiraceae bacterium]
LCDLIFDPPQNNAGFLPEHVTAQQRLFIELIEGEINDKRRYAISRCESVMCAEEPYGIPKYGSAEDARALTPESLTHAWKKVINTARFRVNVLGQSDPALIFEQFRQALPQNRREPESIENTVIRKAGEKVKHVTEKLDIAQGKLCIGFRAGVAQNEPQYAATRVMTDIFGGGPYSKLFQNVREKLSLCYYCAARYNMQKGIILADSGVEFHNFDSARHEIFAQLESLRQGEFTGEEIDASKLSLINSAKSISDSASDLDKWYLDRIFFDDPPSPEEFAAEINAVKKDEITEAANKVTPDTVYSLIGLENTGS